MRNPIPTETPILKASIKLDVFSNSSCNNIFDPTSTNVEFLSQSFMTKNASNVGGSYFANEIIRIFRSIFSSIFKINICASFFKGIFEVFSIGAHPEVFWVNTQAIIARMANKFSIWYYAFKKNPRNSMSFCMTSFSSYKTISVIGFAPDPYPAIFSFYNKFKEPFHGHFGMVKFHGLNIQILAGEKRKYLPLLFPLSLA